MDRTTFFSYVRRAPFGNRLSSEQVKGMNDILDAWGDADLVDRRWLAYALASFFRETGGRMVPVRETFADSTAQAIARLDAAFKAGTLKVSKPYWRAGWFGRGRVQVTHEENYLYAETKTGLPLSKNPDLLLDSKTDLAVSLPGTIEGWWTRGKHKMSDYFNATVDDPVGARAIVNGKDKAKLIAGYYKNFLDAINAAEEVSEPSERPSDVTVEAAKPDDVRPKDSGILKTIGGLFGAGSVSLPFLGNIDNAFALVAFGLLLAAAILVGWLFATGRLTLNRKVTA